MVWKKTEPERNAATPAPTPSQPAGHTQAQGASVASDPVRTEARRDVATIGPSISIKGDLSGKEDLLIQGRVEGGITLKQNNVTVGREGKVQADIHGRSIRVEGEVRGNLYGEEDVVIRQSGAVQGNIVAPRVTLENGSKFKGSIDMEPGSQRSGEAKSVGKRKSSANGKPKAEKSEVAQPNLHLDSSTEKAREESGAAT